MIEGAGGARPRITELAEEAHRIDRLRLDFARKLRLFIRDRGNEDFDGYDSPIEVLRECAHMSWHGANQIFSRHASGRAARRRRGGRARRNRL